MTFIYASQPADPDEFLPPAPQAISPNPKPPPPGPTQMPFDVQNKVAAVIDYVSSTGFVFEPWQIATYITAVRTKPFVILAGISGTGKTKLPRLVSQATGANVDVIPVRPDWTDSSDILGFERINGAFNPGPLLRASMAAESEPNKQYFVVLDEMNIARVEYYLAEVLSRIEERRQDRSGRLVSEALLPHAGLDSKGANWGSVGLPGNLCIVGSVNMDETTHGFSRKVLDRAFTIEFSFVDLAAVGEISHAPQSNSWSASDWAVPATTLSAHPRRDDPAVAKIIGTLAHVNDILTGGQLQFAYRTRDEIVMFCLNAQDCIDSFTTSDAGTVDPLDLAVAMKVLPRIQGGGSSIGAIVSGLQSWADPSLQGGGTVSSPISGTGFPFCAERLELMARRLRESGFTSYWL